MISHYGDNFKLTIFGASHEPEIGMVLEGIPADLPVDMDKLQGFLTRRAPGNTPWSTTRKEADIPHFQSGVTNEHTNGETIRAVIYNENVRRADYDHLHHIPRPGHADFTAWMKYGLDFDMSGGGPFSGRMTAPLCIAGGLCKQWLEIIGIRIGAHIAWISDIDDNRFDPVAPDLDGVQEDFPVLNRACGQQMQEAIAEAKKRGDSLGGIIECAVTGLPVGLGGPMFDGVEGKIAHAMYGIPAVKGVDFGLGFANNKAPAIAGNVFEEKQRINFLNVVVIYAVQPFGHKNGAIKFLESLYTFNETHIVPIGMNRKNVRKLQSTLLLGCCGFAIF